MGGKVSLELVDDKQVDRAVQTDGRLVSLELMDDKQVDRAVQADGER